MNKEFRRIPRLHVAHELHPGASFDLPNDAAHHAARVLRLTAGSALTLFDGHGGEYESRIVAMARNRVTVAVGAHHALERESPLMVTLVQGLAGSDKMDFIIQKAVELGVGAIQPLLTTRSVVRLAPDRARTKLAHWQRVVIAACEQCGRNRVPEVRGAVPLRDYCATPQAIATRLLLSPRGEARLADVAVAAGSAVVLAAGPEAGFGPKDETLLLGAGFVPVCLGPRILRAETAPLAALAALNALRGDF